jgi:tRNA nucleotidyltransferase (CCA-adding enzyme)
VNTPDHSPALDPGPIPDVVVDVATRVANKGGRALLVGGCVRDRLLGRIVKDWDIEVYGIAARPLERVLRAVGRVNNVGRSFGVLKVATADGELDVSIPRRDSNAGPGHRGIHAESDPTMSIREAARRRDLTVNAILLDPLTQQIVDPFHGRADLDAGLLRAVDPDTFLEDPLRALRVVQFAARLEMQVAPELLALCRDAPLAELPAERIAGEWQKLLLRGRRPSLGLAVAREANILQRVFPEVDDAPQSDQALDSLAAGPRDALTPEGAQWAVMLAAWLHGATPAAVEATLDRLWLHKWKGFPLRDQVQGMRASWTAPITTDADLRRLATTCQLGLLLVARGAFDEPVSAALARAGELGVLEQAPDPVLKGRHLLARGVRPGPNLGVVLRAVYDAQLAGDVTEIDGATALAFRIIAETDAAASESDGDIRG